MKKQSILALAIVLTLGILPGCGKSKANDPLLGGAYGGIGVGGTISNGNMCVAAGTVTQSVSFPITGTAQIGVTGFSSQASIGGAGFVASGNYYTRQNAAGDTINLILTGAPNSTGTINGTVTLSPMTVATVQYYAGGSSTACVQGVLFNNTGVTAGSPGLLYSGIYLVVNGYYISM